MLAKTILVFALWKILLIVAALFAARILPLQTHSIANQFMLGTQYINYVWANFDGVHYITIAQFGYAYPNFAFFPLFPLLISLVHNLLSVSLIHAALWITNISFLFALFFVYKITMIDFNKHIAFRTIIMLLIFPTAFFYTAVYADSLYLMLSTVSFYAGRKSNWLMAGVFGFFASLARLVGALLIVALLVEWYLQKRSKMKNQSVKTFVRDFVKERVFFVFLIPLGTVAYGMYLQLNFGDFFLFQKSMVAWHQDQFVFPLQVVYRYLKILVTAAHNYIYFVALVEFVATITYIALSVYVLRKVRISYGVLMLATLLLPTFTGTFQSMPRYILHLFPAFIGLALITSRSKKVFWAVALVFVALELLFVAFFTRGYFIA